ncbi:MAG TPA: hypothetical protein VMU42_07715 [Candidatus Sulfotelmatobacter sp.]|nr:hypothetical protein [Candidatus Sulfotelmatobacter sp.]
MIDASTTIGACTRSAWRKPSSRPSARSIERDTIEQQEDDRRQQDIGDQRMTRDAVQQPLPGRKRLIFLHGKARRIDVAAGQSSVEIVPVGVMGGVMPPPIRVGRQSEQAAQHADRVVGAMLLDAKHAAGAQRPLEAAERCFGFAARHPVVNIAESGHEIGAAGRRNVAAAFRCGPATRTRERSLPSLSSARAGSETANPARATAKHRQNAFIVIPLPQAKRG